MTEPQLSLGFDAADLPAAVGTKPKPRRVSAPKVVALLDAEAMATTLERHPDYRVLRRLMPVLHFDRQPQGPVIRVLVLDTETTGLATAALYIRGKLLPLPIPEVAIEANRNKKPMAGSS